MTRAPSESESGGWELSDDRERVEQAVHDLRAADRADDAFDFLYRRFSLPLLRQLVSWGANPDEARDLNQEIFQRIFQSVGSFQGGDHLFESWVAWMWKIARTTWLRSGRYKRAVKRHKDFLPPEEGAQKGGRVAQPAPQLDSVLAQEARQMVREAIDQLPEQEFKCVILYYYQGMKTQEVAVVLRIAPGTVKAHLNHARAKLKKRLGEYFEFGDEPATALKAEEQRD